MKKNYQKLSAALLSVEIEGGFFTASVMESENDVVSSEQEVEATYNFSYNDWEE